MTLHYNVFIPFFFVINKHIYSIFILKRNNKKRTCFNSLSNGLLLLHRSGNARGCLFCKPQWHLTHSLYMSVYIISYLVGGNEDSGGMLKREGF